MLLSASYDIILNFSEIIYVLYIHIYFDNKTVEIEIKTKLVK